MPRLDLEDNPVTALRGFLCDELKHRLPGHDAEVDVAVGESVERLCDEHGGQSVYLHKNHEARQGKVYAAIVADFDGLNYRELSVKYGKSVERIRQILRTESKRRHAGKSDQEKP